MMYRIVAFTIMMTDLDDPDLAVAEPIWKWQKTEEGKWVNERSLEKPTCIRTICYSTLGYRYDIVAYLDERDLTYWRLKYG